MNRVFCLSSCKKKDIIEITDKEQLHHLHVLRVVPGEKLAAFDEKGNEYRATLSRLSRNTAVLAVEEAVAPEKAATAFLTVACAVPKKSHFDDIVDKLTQVGVDSIIPMVTERVIVRMDKADAAVRQKRWEKIALNASLQSQRNTVPFVSPVKDFESVILGSSGSGLKLIATLVPGRKSLKETLVSPRPQSVLALIGPEGDFSPSETRLATGAGFVPVSFGANVLRVETAAVYIASAISYEYGL
jgi:16S rRNA (uracil1498-N3)-methyltransferase